MIKLKRLAKLADHLASGKLPKKFDMHTWDCGTAACAFGHAALIPAFRRLGLRAGDSEGPNYRGRYGHEAAIEFFGISGYDSVCLFSTIMYAQRRVTRLTVVKRIRKYVKDHTPKRTKCKTP